MDFQGDLFSSHHLASKHLVSALLSIFVDIEHTGESMEFEDKFSNASLHVQVINY